MMKVTFFLSLLLLLLCPLVMSSGMGVTPPSQVYLYYGQDSFEGSFTVLPREPKNLKIFVSDGDLKDYLTLEGNQTEIRSFVQVPSSFKYSLKLPSDIKPGDHTVRIVIEQYLTPEEQLQLNGMVAYAAIGFLIKVRVPNDGKHIEATLVAEPNRINLNEVTYFKLDILNIGTEDLSVLGSDIVIKDSKGSVLATRETTQIPFLKAGERGQIKAYWDTKGFGPGSYFADTSLDYGSTSLLELQATFRIGDIYIRITNVTTILNESISKIFVDIESNWNDKIPNVYAEIKIKGNDSIIHTIKSSAVNLEPWGKAQLVSFWERKDTQPGNYTINIYVYYYDKQAQRQTLVTLPELEKNSPVVILNNNSMMLIVVILLGVILVVNMLWFFTSFKKKAQKKKH